MAFSRSVLQGKARLAAGQRDTLVAIEKRPAADAPGASGRPVETWSALANEWMAKTDLRADERFAGNSETASAETQWFMLYREDMDPDLLNVPKLRRLKLAGRIHDIVTASLVGNKDGIELISVAQVQN